MKSPVVIIGSFNQDLAFYTEQFPKPGETIAGELRMGPGGKGFNQAVAASRTGIGTLFIGAIGDDAFGEQARKFAADSGLNARFIEKPKHATGAAAITVNAAGQNEVIISLGANLALRPRDIPAGVIDAAEVVVCQAESDYATVGHVLRAARQAGAMTVFNPAPMRAGFDPKLLKHTSVLIPNETEFIALVKKCPTCSALLRTAPFNTFDEFNETALRSLAAEAFHRLCRCLQVPVVIVTLGARGCFVSHPDGSLRIHPHDVDVVDTTGAGDAFVGGFAAGLVRFKHNIIEAAHFANAIAALCVMRPGTAPAMPAAREIARFLRKRS